MENISEHISYSEAIYSPTAVEKNIDNTPTAEQLESMKYVANNIFERVRKNFGKPIRINSFFRSYKANKAVGGSLTSQHCKGEAIDVTGVPYGVKNSEIFHYIKDNLDFDQLIWEFGDSNEPSWVHFSLSMKGNNRQVIKAVKEANGKTTYKPYR
jgi:D-alanyl-D-alanine dipeptidase